MKIRTSFISNSSSSSFVAVGWWIYDNKEAQDKLVKLLGINNEVEEDDWWGLVEQYEKYSIDYGQYQHNDLFFILDDTHIGFVGVEVTSLLEKDMKLSEIKELAKEKARELELDLEGEPELVCSETSSG